MSQGNKDSSKKAKSKANHSKKKKVAPKKKKGKSVPKMPKEVESLDKMLSVTESTMSLKINNIELPPQESNAAFNAGEENVFV